MRSGIYLPHPGLQKGGLPGLPGGMEHPIELVANVPVQLGTYEAFFRGQHIVHFGTAGPGGIEKPDRSFFHT
jgi:hypothetical protein